MLTVYATHGYALIGVLFILFFVSRLVIASILLSHRLLSKESGLYQVT